MIEVLSSVALATVQDLGRFGALGWGVSHSGAMDRLALSAGNLMLGNDEGMAAIEIPVFPFLLRFHQDCAFVLTGADHQSMLEDSEVLPWMVHHARQGQVLRIDRAQDSLWPASRVYVCVAGGIDVPLALGSRSTQLRGQFGGFRGRTLHQGDLLPVGETLGQPVLSFGLTPPALALPLMEQGVAAVRVLPAAEYDAFTEDSLKSFWSQPWKISAQSDRYGYRLAGPRLEPKQPLELRSHGIVPGVIQVPHGGQPIIQMRDAQPSGGYPKIGTVIDADLWRLGQAPIGSSIRFLQTSWDEAVAALHEMEEWLAEARRMITIGRLLVEGGRHVS